MPKTQEELNALKDEVKTLNNKLKELTEDEIELIVGGEIGDWNNIEHSGISIKNQGSYSLNYDIVTPNNVNNIPLPSDEKLKS